MAFPSDLVRTKNWGSEVLTDSDLEGQYDLIINWVMAALNATTGHNHDGSSNQGPEINITNLTVGSQAQGDVIYASSASAWARLGAGTSGQVLKTGGASANPAYEDCGSVLGSYRNLKVVRNSATQVTVTADELVLCNNASRYVRIKSVSEAIAITTSGASGLVTSLSEAANTIYYIWIARKSSDGTLNGYLSTTTSLTTFLTQVDSGYDQAVLVTAVGNNGSSNFIDFVLEGNLYTFVAAVSIGSANTASAWTAIDLTPATLTFFVPPALSTVAFGTLGGEAQVGISNIAAPGTLATNIAQVVSKPGTVAVGTQLSWRFHILTADTLYYATNDATNIVFLHGFEQNKLV